MDIDFTKEDILFIYGRFKREIHELESLKANPKNPIDVRSINQEIKLYSSVTDKIEKVYPNISSLNNYLKKL